MPDIIDVSTDLILTVMYQTLYFSIFEYMPSFIACTRTVTEILTDSLPPNCLLKKIFFTHPNFSSRFVLEMGRET